MSYAKIDRFLRDESTLKQVQAEAQRQRAIASANYAARQAAINKRNSSLQDGNIKGFGRRVMSIDRDSYFHWLAVDPHFFDDPANLKKLQQNNPEIFRTNG